MKLGVRLNKEQIKSIKDIMANELMDLGVKTSMMIDLAGNIIIRIDNSSVEHDLQTLATLTASNIGSLEAMSRVLGEKEFPMLILRAKNDSIHFSKINKDLLLISIFSHEISIGFIRLRLVKMIKNIRELLG